MNERASNGEGNTSLQQGTAVIFDIGANNGDDIPYYLRKANVVVAVEANPELCRQLRSRFSSEIQQQRLCIENCVLTADDQGACVPFYISKSHHVLSQFPVPSDNPDLYERVLLPGRSVRQLFEEYGSPYFVKIDIERYDHVVLRSLFNNSIRPYYISAESHSIEVFLLLATLGGYNLFQIVDGASVEKIYRDCPIRTADGIDVYSFPYHSAGPFGEDLAGCWVDAASLFRRLLSEGLGWKDIHAMKESGGNERRLTRIPWRIIYWRYKIAWFAVRGSWKMYRMLFKRRKV